MKFLPSRLVLLTFSLLLLALLPASAAAGPWTKSTGEAYVKLGQSFYNASEFRTGQGVLISGLEYFSATTYMYGEVGIWENLHIQAYVPLMYSRVTTGPLSQADFGFGDAQIGIQSSPFDLPFPTSLRLEARVPLYGPPATPQTPARGGQQLDFTLWLSAGGGLPTIPLYLYADVGYQHRTAVTFDDTVVPDYSDGLVGLAQVGYTIADLFILAVNSSLVLPFEADGISESYVTLGPSIFFPVNDHLALEVDGYFTPYARASAQGWAAGFGVSYRLD